MLYSRQGSLHIGHDCRPLFAGSSNHAFSSPTSVGTMRQSSNSIVSTGDVIVSTRDCLHFAPNRLVGAFCTVVIPHRRLHYTWIVLAVKFVTLPSGPDMQPDSEHLD